MFQPRKRGVEPGAVPGVEGPGGRPGASGRDACRGPPLSKARRASAMARSEHSSTNTCGAMTTSPANGVRKRAGMDERDGGAVAVADEQGPFDIEGRKDRRQAPLGLDMHVVDRECDARRQRRPTIAEAGIDPAPPRPVSAATPVGEIAPEGGRPEPLMQEHQRRQGGVALDPAIFDLAFVERQPAFRAAPTAHCAELVALDLAGRRFGQFAHEFDPARIFVGCEHGRARNPGVPPRRPPCPPAGPRRPWA